MNPPLEPPSPRSYRHALRGSLPVIVPLLACLTLAPACADARPDPAQVAAPDPGALVARLGSERFDDRVAAYKALEALGAEALPALRAAADAGDPRVRTRARDLIAAASKRAEVDRVARPTPVRLGFRGRPLGEIVTALNDRHDLGLILQLAPMSRRRGGFDIDQRGPDRLAQLRARKVTVEADRPLPFWEAIDRLCVAAALRYDVSPGSGAGTGRDAFLLLADRTGRGPVSDSGPFRVQVAGVDLTYQRDFTGVPDPLPPAGTPPGSGDLTITLAVLGEPGLLVHPAGPWAADEAVDDRGRTLAARAPAATKAATAAVRHYVQGMGDRGPFRVNAGLVAPDPPPASLRRLRGRVPVVVVSRGPTPLVIPLGRDAVLGKPIRTRDVTLSVDSAALTPGAEPSVTVTFRSHRAEPRPDADPTDFAAFRMDRVLEHVDLRDAEGKRLNYVTGMQMRGADGEGFFDRYTLVVKPAPGNEPARGFFGGASSAPAAVPVELRYHDFVQRAFDLPFDLHDIPMP